MFLTPQSHFNGRDCTTKYGDSRILPDKLAAQLRSPDVTPNLSCTSAKEYLTKLVAYLYRTHLHLVLILDLPSEDC